MLDARAARNFIQTTNKASTATGNEIDGSGKAGISPIQSPILLKIESHSEASNADYPPKTDQGTDKSESGHTVRPAELRRTNFQALRKASYQPTLSSSQRHSRRPSKQDISKSDIPQVLLDGHILEEALLGNQDESESTSSDSGDESCFSSSKDYNIAARLGRRRCKMSSPISRWLHRFNPSSQPKILDVVNDRACFKRSNLDGATYSPVGFQATTSDSRKYTLVTRYLPSPELTTFSFF